MPRCDARIPASQVTLDILVEALGRVNFGCVWDFKGLTSPRVTLNGARNIQRITLPLAAVGATRLTLTACA